MKLSARFPLETSDVPRLRFPADKRAETEIERAKPRNSRLDELKRGIGVKNSGDWGKGIEGDRKTGSIDSGS